MKNKGWQFALALLLAALTVAVGLAMWRLGVWDLLKDRQALASTLYRPGPWGPLIIVALQILQTLLAPIPGQIVGLAAGYLYGALGGTLLCVAGSLLGTVTAVWLARRLGRPLVERLASPELLGRLDAYIERRGTLALFLIFLLPFLPDDIICFVAGLTSIPIVVVAVLALLGRTPGIAASTIIGSQARNLTIEEMLIVGAVSALLALVFVRFQRRIEALMFQVVERSSSED